MVNQKDEQIAMESMLGQRKLTTGYYYCYFIALIVVIFIVIIVTVIEIY